MELALYEQDNGWVDPFVLQGFGRETRIRSDTVKKLGFSSF